MKKSELLQLINENHASLESLAERIKVVEAKRRNQVLITAVNELKTEVTELKGVVEALKQNALPEKFAIYEVDTSNATYSVVSETSADSYQADAEVFKQFDDL